MRRFKLTWLLVAAMALASTAFVSVSRAAAGDHLSGSTFEGADGDLAAVGTLRGGDWNAPAGNVRAPVDVRHDRATGGNDDSFAGGVKEDTVTPSFVTAASRSRAATRRARPHSNRGPHASPVSARRRDR